MPRTRPSARICAMALAPGPALVLVRREIETRSSIESGDECCASARIGGGGKRRLERLGVMPCQGRVKMCLRTAWSPRRIRTRRKDILVLILGRHNAAHM